MRLEDPIEIQNIGCRMILDQIYRAQFRTLQQRYQNAPHGQKRKRLAELQRFQHEQLRREADRKRRVRHG